MSLPTITELQDLSEQYSREKWPSKHREHLGISLIGEECHRKLWYTFRWVKLEQHKGRMRRLFQRGHREEQLFRDFLFWCGFYRREINPITDNYYKASSIDGHYGGTGDDVWVHNSDENFRILAEYKTHNTKRFNELKEQGVKKAQVKHYAQMTEYGRNFQITKALYFAVNKDNDEWYPEWVDLDWQYGKDLESKANTIIHSQSPLPRINENPNYYKCKFCHFQDICHHGECVEENCRSCIFAKPTANATWTCDKYGIIPESFIAKGCSEHQSINR
jgi:hypothetical protein